MGKITREKFKTYNNVFDQFTLRNLFKLSSEGFFEELKTSLALGKEANVFIAEKKDGEKVIVKIYRLENCNFNKMYEYIRPDPRYKGIAGRRREIIFSWTQREFRNLSKARECIRVPTPYKQKDNIIVMEMIGENHPAPQLKDCFPKDSLDFLNKIINNMASLYKKGIIHGDLSKFNILNNDEEPVFIDFSQATLKDNADSKALLIRDIKNICFFFNSKLGIKVDESEVYDIITRIDKVE